MVKKSKILTVGIPFHRGSKPEHFKAAVDSIISQTQRASVCHLVQSGPVSNPLDKLADKYVAENAGFERIFVEKVGLAAALNVSIQRCETIYYARMDSDDISLANRFALQLAYFEKHPSTEILGGWAKEFSTSNGIEKSVLKQMPIDPIEMRNWFHYRNPFIHSTVMFRRDVFHKLGYYDETFLTDQDLQLWGRAINAEVAIANVPQVLIYFRTDNVIGRRSRLDAVIRQAKARFSVKSPSLKYTFLKCSALLFRLLPKTIQYYGYRNFRSAGR